MPKLDSKRIFDIILASLLAILLLPILFILLISLMVLEGRPLFFVSERMKSREESFNLWKLRTMRPETSDQGVSGGNKDERIFPMGRLLRRVRLDEIPQLWNILKGDMSFVGPRPPLRQYVDRFPDTYDRVLSVKPGLTGLATLVFHKREAVLLSLCETSEQTDAVYSRICIPRKARLDLIYQRHQSLCFDVYLLSRTIRAIFT
ncbi:sugar transferase [Shimia abyssi]|uniref:Lipopolysaccharide/colanic/teichoic acid biosynthesis glycosyltransferase n=1 Tax=Shimia abyssi TaxID=1662395 RepID=A0A2P8F7B1_9RHOB|nr:sugar transferase [Shimia abyssi]PSL17587.1 lipopolysaccharide/colanic/teichoic acid biosynthesis glycosyltransferase [Shimia abyssi]